MGIIGVGVGSLLLVWGFMGATFWGLREITIATGLGHIQVGNPGTFDPSRTVEDAGLEPATLDQVTEVLDDRPGVRFSMARVNLEGLVTFGRRTLSFTGTGIDPEKESRLSGVFAKITQGESLPTLVEGAPPSIMLADGLGRSLGCQPGDSVTLLVNMPSGGINALDFTVSGLYKTGFPEMDKRNLLIQTEAAHELLGSPRSHRLIVSLARTGETDAVVRDLSQKFPDLEVHGWSDLATYYNQVVQLYTTVFTIFGLIMTLVVFLAIINTMVMSIMERITEIGTLLAIGLTPRFVTTLFLQEGTLVGLLGSLAGTAMSIVVAFAVNSVGFSMPPAPGRTEPYPLNIFLDFPSSALVIGVITGVVCLAALFPAVRSARAKIIDSLNHV